MPRRRRALRSRARELCRQTLAFLFSNVGVIVLVVGYTVAGAFMFQAIEGASEIERANNMTRERDKTVEYLWRNVTIALNTFNETEMKFRISSELVKYQRKVVVAVKRGWEGGRSSRQWSFSSGFLYSLTVITTIGYGNLAPRTSAGKLATICYALLGMPLFLLYLTNLGEVLARWFKCLYALVCLCKGCPGFSRRRIRRIQEITNTKGDNTGDESEVESVEKPDEWRIASESSESPIYHQPRHLYLRSKSAPFSSYPNNQPLDPIRNRPRSLNPQLYRTSPDLHGSERNYELRKIETPRRTSTINPSSSFRSNNSEDKRRRRIYFEDAIEGRKDLRINLRRDFHDDFDFNTDKIHTLRSHSSVRNNFKEERRLERRQLEFSEIENIRLSKNIAAYENRAHQNRLNCDRNNEIKNKFRTEIVKTNDNRDKRVSVNNSDVVRWSDDSSVCDSEFTYIYFDAQNITVPLSVCVAVMVCYIMFGSMLFGMWENWDLVDGAYFCFISLSSIGFGDFVPGERVYSGKLETSFIACSVYLLLGMALIAMCFNLMQEQVIHYFAGLKRALKRICRCKR